jgi:hypothetical protein
MSRLRSPIERPKRGHKESIRGRKSLYHSKRVHVELMVMALTFNLYQLCTLKNAKVCLAK